MTSGRIAGRVVHVPAKRFEEGIEEFAAELGFVVLAGFVGVELLLETGGEFQDFPRRWHKRFLHERAIGGNAEL
jgi:hypothetical protein